MESWENKIIRDKINSLQNLPGGYAPDLASKWEIIEAGLPEEKKRIPVLVRWSVAATIVIVMLLSGIKLTQHTAPQTGLGASTVTPLQHNYLLFETKQTTVFEKPVSVNTLRLKKPFVKAAVPQSVILVKQESESLVKNEIKTDLFDKNPDSAIVKNNDLVIVIQQPEVPKKPKHKTFQKDFNDGQLVMDTGYSKPANLQFSFKFQLPKSNGDDAQPSQRLQLKQVL